MTEHRSTDTRRKTRAGLVSVRIGATEIGGKPKSYWVPTALARRIEALCQKEEVRRDEMG